MPLITRLTHEIAARTLPSDRYRVSGPLPPIDTAGTALPVYLTFDDGPHPERTPLLLDQLSALGARATFFLCGEPVQSHPQLVRRIRSEGHAIGTHSWSHPKLLTLSLSDWIDDVRRARGEVEAILGERCDMFRPPYGELTPWRLGFLLRESLRIVMWSLDTKDYQATASDQLVEWFATNEPSANCIVLMHDGTPITSQYLRHACATWAQQRVDFLALSMDKE